jgi:hypothetical protein
VLVPSHSHFDAVARSESPSRETGQSSAGAFVHEGSTAPSSPRLPGESWAQSERFKGRSDHSAGQPFAESDEATRACSLHNRAMPPCRRASEPHGLAWRLWADAFNFASAVIGSASWLRDRAARVVIAPGRPQSPLPPIGPGECELTGQN